MSTFLLVMALIAFLCSFIRGWGAIICAILAVITLAICIFKFKKEKEKRNKEAIVISMVISIFAILICIIGNVIYLNRNVNNNDEINYSSMFESYNTYQKGEKVLVEGMFELVVKDFRIDNEKCLVNVSIKPLTESLSIYDFCLLDEKNNEVYYPRYSTDDDNISFRNLIKDEEKTGYINYNVSDNIDTNELYLIYRNENGVKIKI